MIARRSPIPIRSAAIKRKAAKRPQGYDNPEYRAWLKLWPCWVCLQLHCRKHLIGFNECIASVEARQMFYEAKTYYDCGETQVAHVGENAMGLRCPDREAIPLGGRHHLHETAGGGWDSYHYLGRVKFFEHFGIDRNDILEELHRLYRLETGKEV